jgi:ATP-dependent helicase/nuclease subunit A
VKREVPFVFKDDTSEEEFLIQGIIDCYFYEGNEITIVDYKTDKINQFNEQELIARHSIQINYYAKALQELTNKKVANKYLYFFENEEFYKIN